ncbi:universal stress protein [Geodermatophilus sp. SYSU D00691]
MTTSTSTTHTERNPAAGDRQAADPPVREVVVGVDGSEMSLAAVRWAAAEAAARGAPLRIVHAADYLGDPPGPGAPPPELPHARRITATAYTAARHAAPGLTAATEVVPGDATTALLRAGAAAQLLVLGISTTGAADEIVRASVAAHVAARSPQPVAVVPRSRRKPDPDRPVVAVLGSDEPADDDAVAAFAAATAGRTGRRLVLLETHPRVSLGDEWAQRFPDVEVERVAMPGAQGVDVLDRACPTPLLVAGVGHGGRFHRGLDGAHRWLLRHCTSPLVLVPPATRAPESAAGEVRTGT